MKYKLKVGDILKSTRHPKFDGVTIISIHNGRIHFRLKNNSTDNFNTPLVQDEVDKGNFTVVIKKIENWRERLK